MRRLAAVLLLFTFVAGVAHVPTADAWTTSQRCPQYEPAIRANTPKGGWDVARMSHYARRESNCTAVIRSTTQDSGLLQINDVNLAWLSRHFGFRVTRQWLMNATNNIRAAAALCTFWRRAGRSCYYPWS